MLHLRSRKTFIMIMIIFIIMHCFVMNVNAGDWQIIADEKNGLTASPKTRGDPQLFSFDRITPGDSASSAITIKNNCPFPIELTVVTENLLEIPPGEPDLSSQLILSANLDGADIPALASTSGEYLLPVTFMPDRTYCLTLTVNLPGETTGNEFQNTSALLQWKFIANFLIETEPNEEPGLVGEPDTVPSATASRTEEAAEIFTVIIPGGNSDEQAIAPDLVKPILEFLPDLGSQYLGEIQEQTPEPNATLRGRMPQTGESPLYVYIFIGSALALIGTIMLFAPALNGRS